MEINSIEATLLKIKEQIGLNLNLCDYFTGIYKCGSKEYFNVIIEDSIVGGKTYDKIRSLIKLGIISNCEPNGVHRVAIFF